MEKKIEGPYYGTAPTQGSAAHPKGGDGGPGPNETFTNNGNGTNPSNGTDTYNNTIVFGGIGNGGGGGYNTPAPGPGGGGGSSGAGGSGHAYTHTRVNSTAIVFAYATGDGGGSGEAGGPGDEHTAFVGPGDSGGAGGNGVASAYAKNTMGQARAMAKSQGGTGGGAYGATYMGGAGGSGTIGELASVAGHPSNDPAGAVQAIGKSALATAYQYGGQGGGGYAGADGGKGISSTLINAVTGIATDGGLYLNQVAVGGSGGGTIGGTGGAAGYGKSYLTFSDTTNTPTAGTQYEAGTTYLRGISSAVGGSGGGVEGAGTGANGANAYATSTITGPHAVLAEAQAGSTDQGGRGGTSYGGAGGGAVAGTVNAAAVATSTTSGSDNVTATTKTYGAGGGYADGSSGHGNAGAGGAVTGATATATELTATGGLATADVNSDGGTGGSVSSGHNTHAGAGGTVTGAQATATGYSAYASIIQQGGKGGAGGYAVGVGGADGGAGAPSVLTNQANGTVIAAPGQTFGGALRLYQTAIGGTGGLSNGGAAGTAGIANSELEPAKSTTAILLEGASTATGGAGGAGEGGSAGATGGDAESDVNVTGAAAVSVLGSTATGGAGGRSDATPGVGGTADATAEATSTTTQTYNVSATSEARGGYGGSYYTAAGGSGAAGGLGLEATATATEKAATGGLAYAHAINYGGHGGKGIGSGQSGGAGGTVNDLPSGNTEATAIGYSAKAYARQDGGAGGGGYQGEGAPVGSVGAKGGAGETSRLVNAVTGTTYGGSLTLEQLAEGGAGGSSSTTKGGIGGNAYSNLNFVDRSAPQSSSLTGSVTADGGGAGGGSPTGVAGAAGGYGTAQISLTGATLVTANATAVGGAGGTGSTTGVNGAATADAAADATTTTDAIGTGTANANALAIGGGAGAAQAGADAESSATTAAGQEATAASNATGGTGSVDTQVTTTAITAGGAGGTAGVEATTHATGGGNLTAQSTANINTNSADYWTEPGFNQAQNSVYASAAVLAPESDLLNGILSPAIPVANPNIDAVLGVPNATILGYGTQGGYAIAGASGLETLTSIDTFTLNGPTSDLIAGLVNSNSQGNGFSSLTFTATLGGTLVDGVLIGGTQVAASPTFTTLTGPNGADAYFHDHVLDLGQGTSGETVSLSLTLVTSTAGDGFEDSVLLGGAAVTDLTWTGATGTDLATAGNWQPVTVPDALETLTFNLPAGGILTGTATGMNAVFDGEGGWLLQGATLTLAGNGPLAITDAGNVTVIGGTIAAGGGVDIESASGASMTLQSGAEIGALGVSVGFDAGQSGLLRLSGDGTSIENTGTGGSLQIGTGGSGVVTVTGGASLTDAAVDILGVASGGTGELDISAGGSLSDPGLIVGDAGLGRLAITAGGTVVTGTGGTPALIANQTGASGSYVDVTGAGSDWQVAGTLVVGNAAQGALDIAAGATVTAASLVAAAQSGGDGVITVAGTNSLLQLTGSLTLGSVGAGELSILSGAAASALDLTIGGSPALSSGNVDVEGAGSELSIATGGALNIGVADGGGGVLTIGSDAVLNFAGIPTENGHASFNNYGTVDPDGFEYTTASNGNAGLNLYDLYIGNIGAVQVSAGTSTWFTPMVLTGTSVADAANNIGNNGDVGEWQLSNDGTLVFNANTVDAGQAIVFEDATDTLVIGQQVNGGGPGISGVTPTVAAGAMNLLQAGGFAAELWGYQAGDQILLDNLVVNSDSIVGGNTLELFGAGGTLLGELTFFNKAGTRPLGTSGMDAAAAQILASSAPCFAAGTRIASARGEVAVEAIAVGERVRVLLGDAGDGLAEVIWVGRREVDCARHAQPRKVWPVRVAAGAFGPGLPHTDLWLSPDHAVYVAEVLIPVKYLINGSTIVQVPVDSVTYHHIELAAHDVLLAEGLAAESYLDIKDGRNYPDRSEAVRLYPDHTARMWEAFGCARLVVTGPELQAARAMVAGCTGVREAA